MEPVPEPEDAVAAELLKLVTATEASAKDEEEVTAVPPSEVEAVMDACTRLMQEAIANDFKEVAEVVAAIDREEAEADEAKPTWLEDKLGTWVTRRRDGLRFLLLALLAAYVAVFASMVIRGGVRGLGEHTATAAVRDLLWVVLMGLILLLSLAKRY